LSHNKELYPDFFPEGCPPIDAKPIEVKVYRLIKGDKIDNTDFKSFIELDLDHRSTKFPFVEYGISVNTNYDELRKNWRGTGALKKKFKNIGSGITFESTGVVKPTPTKPQKHHHTWWLFKGGEPESYFVIE
jgi:hypothetical protein